MLENEFNQLIKQFGVQVYFNNETNTRKAILNSQTVNDSLPNFDDKTIHSNFQVQRGNVIQYNNVEYLIISDVQSKRSFEYKAIIRPMTNIFSYTYTTEGEIIGYDQFNNPIYAEGQEPQTITDDLPCIAQQEGTPTLENGQITQPETRIQVVMPDNEVTALIEKNTSHTILNNTYNIVDINLLQAGLRIFKMEWTTT